MFKIQIKRTGVIENTLTKRGAKSQKIPLDGR